MDSDVSDSPEIQPTLDGFTEAETQSEAPEAPAQPLAKSEGAAEPETQAKPETQSEVPEAPAQSPAKSEGAAEPETQAKPETQSEASEARQRPQRRQGNSGQGKPPRRRRRRRGRRRRKPRGQS